MSMRSPSDPTPRAFRRIQKISDGQSGLALACPCPSRGPASIAGVWWRSNTRDCDANDNSHGDIPAETPTETPEAMAALTFPDLEGLLGTKDLGVGTNRVSFVLANLSRDW